MTDPRAHAGRRKMLARGFSKSYLRATWEDVVKEKVVLTVGKMKEEGKSGPVDILKWWTLMATDISCHLMFGDSFHTVEKGEVSRCSSYSELVYDRSWLILNAYYRLTHTSKLSKRQCKVAELALNCLWFAG